MRVYREKIVEALGYLADPAFQRRAWLATGGPEVSSFEEDVCQLYDDTGLSAALDRPADGPVFDVHVDDALPQLNLATKRVNIALPITALLESAELRRVRQQAAAILVKIRDLAADR